MAVQQNPKAGFGGLVNMGLTCYANATLQCFRNCHKIAWILEDTRYDTLFKKQPSEKRELQQALARAAASVVQLLGKCERGQSVRPGEFWSKLRPAVADTLYEHLASIAPHDCHEFFLFLLETLHESTAQEVEMRILRPPPASPRDELITGALQSWSREFSKEYSPFVDLFYGLGHWRTTCRACGNVSHRWQSFNSLKGVVPQGGLGSEPPTLLSMLAAEMEPETIQEYHCEKCPQRTEALRNFSIWRLPQTLVVVLKRFTPDGRKIHTRVASLNPDVPLDFSGHFSPESPERAGLTGYYVRGIVDHHGSASFGHYTAQVRRRDDEKWYRYDDEGVSDLPTPQFGDSTYMLFLERGAPATQLQPPPAEAMAKEA
jgi:ubiquitin C-terminal hydrolase